MEPTDASEEKKDMHAERLSKRMSYILRYGAKKEGLQVDDSGKCYRYSLSVFVCDARACVCVCVCVCVVEYNTLKLS